MIYWYMIITMLVTWGKKIPRLPTMNRNNNGYCMVLSGIDDVCVCVRNLYRNTSNMVQIVRGRTTNGLVISSGHHSQILQLLSGCPDGLYSWPNRNSRCDTNQNLLDLSGMNVPNQNCGYDTLNMDPEHGPTPPLLRKSRNIVPRVPGKAVLVGVQFQSEVNPYLTQNTMLGEMISGRLRSWGSPRPLNLYPHVAWFPSKRHRMSIRPRQQNVYPFLLYLISQVEMWVSLNWLVNLLSFPSLVLRYGFS